MLFLKRWRWGRRLSRLSAWKPYLNSKALDDRIITSPPENPQALAETMVSVLQKGKRAAQSRSEGSLRAFDPVEIAAQYKKFL